VFSSSTPTPNPTSPTDPNAGPFRRRPRPQLLPLLVMGVAVPAIFATVALPAYAYRTGDETAISDLEAYKAQAAQTFELSTLAADEPIAVTGLESYTTTSAAQLAREAQAAAYRSYSGPSVSDLLANPPYPGYDPATIVSIAMQYVGSPYVYGGASPAGFDCSGFTQFVFAHVGISLPHSSSAQGRMTAIDPAAMLPGDLIITDGGGHVGIYIGNGQMVHASTPATGVKVGAPWGNWWVVRAGI
jgi:cell wall-associated NlpC family hydrolase